MALGSEGSPPNSRPGNVISRARDAVSSATPTKHTNEKASVSNISSVRPPLWETGAATLHDRAGDVEEHTRGKQNWSKHPKISAMCIAGRFLLLTMKQTIFLTTDRSRGCYFFGRGGSE
jgi:hypothetical protein